AYLVEELLSALSLRANERKDEVRPRDDPDELLVIDDHQPVDLSACHQPSGLGERLVRPNGDRRTRHRLAGGRRLQLLFAGLKRFLIPKQTPKALLADDPRARLL